MRPALDFFDLIWADTDEPACSLAHAVRIQAVNFVGESDWATTPSPVLTTAKVADPTLYSALFVCSPTTLQLVFDSVSNDGGSPGEWPGFALPRLRSWLILI